jgi:peptide/nickel transport system substrate-binding protein
MSVRRLLILASIVAALLGVIAAGCGGDDDAAPPPPAEEPAPAEPVEQEPAPPEPAPAEPAEDLPSTLVILEPEVAPGLNPDGSQVANPQTQELFNNLYETLIHYERSEVDGVAAPNASAIEPRLAESWEQDGLEWTFALQQGVISCAGNEMTADDVVWTFERAKSVSGTTPIQWFLLNTQSVLGPEVFAEDADRSLAGEIEKVDDFTVIIRQSEVNEMFPSVLSVAHMGIFDSAEMMTHATEDDPWAHDWAESEGAAGFGAYCIREWNKDEKVVLDANPGYYRGQPQFTTVEVRKVPQSGTRVTALLSGEVDVVTGLTPQEYNEIAESGDAKVLSWDGNQINYLAMNYEAEPWLAGGDADKQRLVRQAIAHALNYDGIIEKVFFGNARKMEGVLVPGFTGSVEFPGRYPTDVEKAKELMAQAGFPDGAGFEGPGLQLNYPAESQSLLEPLATEVQTSLAQIGINFELNPIPNAQFVDLLLVQGTLPAWLREKDIVIGPDAGYHAQLSYTSPETGLPVDNGQKYRNDTVDELFFQAKVATGQERLDLLEEIQVILYEDLPRIPLVVRPLQIAVREDLTGFGPTYDLGIDYWYFRDE